MRFLLLALPILLISCGQNTKSSSGPGPDKQNEEYVTDVKEVDLLDVAVDARIEVNGTQIIFKEAANNSVNGVASSCSVGVSPGEIYTYRANGNSLEILTSTGKKMKFERISGSGNSIVGSWTGKDKEGNQYIMRKMTFLGQERVVMRTHCES